MKKTVQKNERYLYLLNRFDELNKSFNNNFFVRYTGWCQILCIPFAVFVCLYIQNILSTRTFLWDQFTKLTALSILLFFMVLFLMLDAYRKARALDMLGQELLFFISILLENDDALSILIEGYSGEVKEFAGIEIPESFFLLFTSGHYGLTVKNRILETIKKQRNVEKKEDQVN